jgi:dTDP-4-dehydrorhamnose reductase
MRVLVLGASGMLGHQLCRSLSKRLDVWATVSKEPSDYAMYHILPGDRLVGWIDIRDLPSLQSVIKSIQPQTVVNAVGIVKQRDEARQAVPSIQVNALFPHQLADLCNEHGIRAIQISTDCVFSGQKGKYLESDNPDPVDLYGRTKLLGELDLPNTLTLRTSIIGWELNNFSGLLSWFALQRGKNIKGFLKAIYSGVSTAVLSTLIGDIIETHPDLQGLYHVASLPISKYDLLTQLKDVLGWNDISIAPDDEFACDRSLNGLRFSTITGWQPPSWAGMLDGLVKEWSDYSKWYPRYSN